MTPIGYWRKVNNGRKVISGSRWNTPRIGELKVPWGAPEQGAEPNETYAHADGARHVPARDTGLGFGRQCAPFNRDERSAKSNDWLCPDGEFNAGPCKHGSRFSL